MLDSSYSTVCSLADAGSGLPRRPPHPHRSRTRSRTRKAAGAKWAAALAFSALAHSSRVYLSVHWATDVTASFALGAAATRAFVTSDLGYGHLPAHPRRQPQRRRGGRGRGPLRSAAPLRPRGARSPVRRPGHRAG
ncbi:phosphatase PAP2 family protein [Streptomyces sp. NPDC059650]|uniref:phosphatase PAP2 family protein n=1 Tax=Streptomyces sp. NPDC059650 TaxID=3346896 RepID=UPI00369A4BA7